jgi:hypothetical protein
MVKSNRKRGMNALGLSEDLCGLKRLTLRKKDAAINRAMGTSQE